MKINIFKPFNSRENLVNFMIIQAKAPVRISFGAVGDTDYYINLIGTGYALNATIDKYSYCQIHPRADDKIVLRSLETNHILRFNSIDEIEFDSRELNLMKAVVKHFGNTGIEVVTYTDAPLESGLGGSAAHTVSMIKAFLELNGKKINNEEIARLAYDLERNILRIEGGYQDQWASAFGGINYLQFSKDGSVISPIKLNDEDLKKLEEHLLLINIPRKESGSNIHTHQKKDSEESLAMLSMKKENLHKIKECLEKKNFDDLGNLIHLDWKIKKHMTSIISDERINKFYDAALDAGAVGGRLIGAGSGGCFLFYCKNKPAVINALKSLGGKEIEFKFERVDIE